MRRKEQKIIMNKLLKNIRTQTHILEKEGTAWRTQKKKKTI